MDAAQTFHRCLFRAVFHSSRCHHTQNKLMSITTKKNPKTCRHRPRLTSHASIPSSTRTYSSSSIRFSEATEPQNNVVPPKTPPVPASPIEARRLLQSYISTMQKIAKTQKLDVKMAPRDYEKVMVTVMKAEAALGAGNRAPENFETTLKSLKTQVEPILQKVFNSTDVEKIASGAAGSISNAATSSQSATTPPTSSKPSATESLNIIFSPSKARQPATPSPQVQQRDSAATLSGIQNIYKAMGQRMPTQSELQSSTSTMAGITGMFGAKDITEQERAQRDKARQFSASILDQLEQNDRLFGVGGKQQIQVLRLKPSLGRSVQVTPSFDVNRAFRQLESHCARNNVKRDQIAQMYHVRRGMEKKKLRMKRWRILFKEGFVAECSRVRRLWKQGW